MNILQLKTILTSGEADAELASLYGAAGLDAAKARALALSDAFTARFGEDAREVALISVPGRSELAGNHTDHNHGCVIAASIDLDVLAIAAPRADGVACVESEVTLPLKVAVCLSVRCVNISMVTTCVT